MQLLSLVFSLFMTISTSLTSILLKTVNYNFIRLLSTKSESKIMNREYRNKLDTYPLKAPLNQKSKEYDVSKIHNI